jgi:DNA-binding protein HU-beta
MDYGYVFLATTTGGKEMTQAELIAAIAEISGAKQTTVKDVLAAMSTITREALTRGDELTLPGIGKVTVKDRPARTGRNPATGEAIEIPARRVVRLVPAKVLKEALV